MYCVSISRALFQVQGDWHLSIDSFGARHNSFFDLHGLALTPDEAFLLAVDEGNHRVVVLRATDGSKVRALTGPPGTLDGPWGVACVVSTGEVLVSDTWLHQVVRFRSFRDGTVVGRLGTGEGFARTRFSEPRGMVVLEGRAFSSVCSPPS